VNATIKLNGQAMFEAVEIDDAVLDAALAAKFRPPAADPEGDAMPLFQLRFGYAVARGRAASGCAWQGITGLASSANT
jgi:hypothetical protein